ncbi:MAG: McrC family protein [Syntrophales bacterium]
MLRIDLEEHRASDPLQLSAADVQYLMSEHATHVDLRWLKDGRYVITAKSFVGYIVISDVVISIRPKVHNENLIYMLTYLFKIPSGDTVQMASDAENPMLDIIAMVLINRIKQLVKRGMFRGYIKKKEYITGLKGKLPLSRNIFYTGKLYCEFDELSYSVYVNIILKSTLRLLLSMRMSRIVKEEAKTLIMIMSEISDIEIDEKLFSRLYYSQLNLHYKPLIDFCYLIYRSINIRNNAGITQFSSFIINMNDIFEEFIRGYLKEMLYDYDVKRRSISNWASSTRQDLLPDIQPDIVIDGKLVIDVKYYRDLLTNHGKLNSSNLYQIITYMNVMNLPGLLIYPYNDIRLKDGFNLKAGNMFSVITLDLGGSFNSFQKALKDLLAYIDIIIKNDDVNKIVKRGDKISVTHVSSNL